MADTKIDWADKVWNVVAGCTKCSPGCRFCYAERMAIRLNGIFAAKGDEDNWAKMTNVLKWDYSKPELYEFGKATGWNGEIELFVNRLDQPLHWRKPRRIFICSMSDLFHPKVPFEFIDKVFDVMFGAHWHTYLILTKRIKRMARYISYFKKKWESEPLSSPHWSDAPNQRIQLGVSISTQPEADEKIPILLQIPAAVRWLSIEPMLEEIDLHISDSRKDIIWRRTHKGSYERQFLSWVVIGAESGPGRRPCKLEWIRSIVRQCKAASVPVFVKQVPINGKVSHNINEFPKDLQIRKVL